MIAIPVQAQNCSRTSFSITYRGSNPVTISQSVITPQGEVVAIGSIAHTDPNYADGWITKFTASGTVIWSKKLTSPRYTAIRLMDIIAATDTSVFAVGYITDTTANTFSHYYTWGVLIHINKYGQVLWSALLDHYDKERELTRFTSILKTRDGDFIVPVRVERGLLQKSYYKVLRLDVGGHIKWSTTLQPGQYAIIAINRDGLLQLSDSRIVIATLASQFDAANVHFVQSAYYFLCFDYATGALIWQKGFFYSKEMVAFQPAIGITEEPGGDLSFQTDIRGETVAADPPFVIRSARITTDKEGTLKKVTSYFTGQPRFTTLDVRQSGSASVVLASDERHTALFAMDNHHNVAFHQGYTATGEAVQPATLAGYRQGYYLFFNAPAPGTAIRLAKTDIEGAHHCLAAADSLYTAPLPLLQPAPVAMPGTTSLTDTAQFTFITTMAEDYQLESRPDCDRPQPVTVAPQEISLCSRQAFTLPDGVMVQDSGTYYTLYHTSTGCDSLRYFHVSVHKDPALLTLSGPDCLPTGGVVLLKATTGYEHYNWLNNITSDSTYTISHPGTYWVQVANSCGQKSDSLTIAASCTTGVLLPNAFTPNGDGLNDVFRLPPTMSVDFIRLAIYNRWGHKVFETNDPKSGWDGKYSGTPQPAGTYVYYLKWKRTDGKLHTKNGLIQLIR